MKIKEVSDKWLETTECPFCSSDKTIFLKKVREDCNCIFKRKVDYLIFECESCKEKYKIKR